MRKELPIGISNYHEVKEHHKYYVVDKSKMIEDFLKSGSKVTLITRPRRFGKTLNMSMLNEFFDITKDSKDIFKDTYIMQSEYASYINEYPTIFLSFANVKGNNNELVRHIKLLLRKEFDRFHYIFTKEMSEFQKDEYIKLKEDLFNLEDLKLYKISNALVFLMDQLYAYYGKRVMVFIDEYDTPFIQAKMNGCYEEIRNGLSEMLHQALKLSNSLQYAMLTGIQRVAKENIFSGLNNLDVYTVRDKQYASYFGFTNEEVQALLSYYDIPFSEEVKKMYNGYRIGGIEIYNPWSMMNYAKRQELVSYWVNTSENLMIKEAMKQSDISFQKEYEQLLQEGSLTTMVRLETSFYEMSSTASLWGLFVNAGYVTIIKTISSMDEVYELRIPNHEVQQEFKKLTSSYLEVEDSELMKLYEALRRKKEEEFRRIYEQLLLKIPSYHDLKSENSYHMFFVGLCTWFTKEYEIISNEEKGKGRCDIILKSKDERMSSYVIEMKYTKEESDLKQLAEEAIQQIKEKQYDIGLGDDVVYIGMAHYHKEVEIVWEK